MPFDFEEATDEQLLGAFVAERDQDAIEALVRRHEGRVYGLAYRLLGNRADAADAAQEAFVLLIRKAKDFRGESAFSTWFYRIVVNASHDLRRKSSRQREIPTEEMEIHAETSEMQASDRIDLERALISLLPEQREAVVLRDIIGLSYQEIAETTGTPVGTVKSRIARARLALADLLGNRPAEARRLSEQER